jgi:hypothetical protein
MPTKVSFVRGLKMDDDKLTQNLLRFFTKEIKNRPNINVLTSADILIPEDQLYNTPEHLKLAGIRTINGYFVSN